MKSLCNNVKDMEEILNIEFGTILTYLELNKAEEEITYISNEVTKTKLKK